LRFGFRTVSSCLLLAAAFAATACSRPESSSAATPPASADAPAARIVSLAPVFTETLVALGASERLVAIGRFDPEVPGRGELPRIGDSFGVELETLLSLRVDAVLVNARALVERLAPVASRLRVVELPTDRLEDSLAAVTRVARIAGREEVGRALVARIRDALAAARLRADARAAGGSIAPRVLVVVQRRPYYSAGKGSFVDDLLRAVGAENAIGDVDRPWPTIGEETIVARAPTVILDASVGDVDTVEGREALLAEWLERFPTVPAVRDGRVFVIREDALFRAGPRIPEALEVLERLLYGGSGK
jgi:iron complex transport system substrate-binding protein